MPLILDKLILAPLINKETNDCVRCNSLGCLDIYFAIYNTMIIIYTERLLRNIACTRVYAGLYVTHKNNILTSAALFMLTCLLYFIHNGIA